jgi:aryl-alcohol dehydrogenase-like predicted oxidoreductase
MEYRRLGNSGLKVSAIGLGANNFGARANEETSIKIIKYALDTGVNFIDTAAMYVQGHSEEIVGRAVHEKRSQFIIATKFGHPVNVNPTEQGGSRSYIIKAVEDSLKRLNTDYIDLYYMHHTDPDTPIEETLRALDDLIHAGKVRYTGYSNCDAWQVNDAAWTSRYNHIAGFTAVEMNYSLIDRNVERELIPCCLANGIGFVPYAPLARGFLTGKYHRGEAIPAQYRLYDALPIYDGILSDANFNKLERLESFAKERCHSVGELAIAWLLAHPIIGSVIAGVSNIKQLAENIAAVDWKLTPDDVKQVNAMT